MYSLRVVHEPSRVLHCRHGGSCLRLYLKEDNVDWFVQFVQNSSMKDVDPSGCQRLPRDCTEALGKVL